MKYNLTGQRLLYLNSQNVKIVWHCKCDCGNECDVVSRFWPCGCLKIKQAY